MDDATVAVAKRSTAGSDAGTMAFPKVVGAMMAAGIERDYADLVRAEKTWFLRDGDPKRWHAMC